MPTSFSFSPPSCWPFVRSAKSSSGDLSSCSKWLPDLWCCSEQSQPHSTAAVRVLPPVLWMAACHLLSLLVSLSWPPELLCMSVCTCVLSRIWGHMRMHQRLFTALLLIQVQMDMVCHTGVPVSVQGSTWSCGSEVCLSTSVHVSHV